MALLAALALGAGAWAADPATAVTRERNSAVGYALTMDQVTRSFAGKCDAADRGAARRARNAWDERNAESVRAADRYLDFVRGLLARTQGEEAARRFYEEKRTAFAARAQMTVVESLLAGGEREVCAQVLETMARGGMDLRARPAHYETLQEIRAELAGGNGRGRP